MRVEILNKIKYIGKIFSTDLALKLSPQKLILPYYHTVTNSPKEHYKQLGYYRELEIFTNDLYFFQNNFESVSIGNLDDTKKSFHLSFDDGLKENFSIVAQLLKERKIHATFFINTDFIDNKNMFIRHKISLIINELKNSEINRKLVSDLLKVEEINLIEKINCIKINATVDEIASLIQINFKDYLEAEQPYLSLKELKEMKKMGFSIGNHSIDHPHFSNLNFAEQKYQVEYVNNFLSKEILQKELYFCFPFGDDLVENEFFEWMYSDSKILKSFGTSGLKKDHFEDHYHRILMEHPNLEAEDLIKAEYIYYFAKAFFNKNKIRR